MKLVKFRKKILIEDGRYLYTKYQKANDLQCWALMDEGDIFRFHKKIGKVSELISAGEIDEKALEKYKINTKDCSFSELVGETITSLKLDETPLGFWGDSCDRFIIKCKSGRGFIMETGGGTNLMGFPGSQSHGVWIKEIVDSLKVKGKEIK